MTTARTATHPIHPMFLERWSPRSLTGEAIASDTLMSLFEAARWAPSASNMQPWRFLFGRTGTPAFQTILDGLVPFNQGWANKASALIVVLSKQTSVAPGQTEAKPNPWHSFDAGSAWMSFALQAHHAGWVTHGMGGFDGAKLRESLNIPVDVSVECVVAVGKRGDKAALPEGLQARELPNDRVPLAQIVAEGGWAF
jgi:nitroreductase